MSERDRLQRPADERLVISDDEAQRLRALVDPIPGPGDGPPRRLRVSKRGVKMLGYLIAGLIVVASAVVASLILWNELFADDGDVSVATATASPTTPPTAQPVSEPTSGAVAGADVSPTPLAEGPVKPFEELRYLPAGDTRGLHLQSILRVPDAAPLAAYTRVNDDTDLTAVMLVDAVGTDFATGVGVVAPQPVEVDGVPGTITGTGSPLSNVTQWEHPQFGTLRAWGLGLTATDHSDTLNQLISGLGTTDAVLPEQWAQIESYGSDTPADYWRSYYLHLNGEVAVTSTSIAPGATAQCFSVGNTGGASCPNIRTRVDDDNVEIAAFASERRVDEFVAQLRPTSEHNSRVANGEFEPLAEAPLGAAGKLLYLPQIDSEWQVIEVLAHTSGRTVTEPVITLVERDVPDIGAVTSAVVVRALPLEAAEPSNETIDEDVEVIFRARDGVLLQIQGWGHTQLELAIVELLIVVDNEGIRYASRAGAGLGLERRYESVGATSAPRTLTEGTVFGALVESASGAQVSIRVSSVPSFHAESMAVAPRTNEIPTIEVRGTSAALIVDDSGASLTWQEEPGTLITLNGADESELLQLAQTLERVDIDALVVDTATN